MSPTLIDEPLCKTGINQRCTFYFLEMFINFRTTESETLSILSPLEIYFLLNFQIKDKY